MGGRLRAVGGFLITHTSLLLWFGERPCSGRGPTLLGTAAGHYCGAHEGFNRAVVD